jgi:hypothetical protein
MFCLVLGMIVGMVLAARPPEVLLVPEQMCQLQITVKTIVSYETTAPLDCAAYKDLRFICYN